MSEPSPAEEHQVIKKKRRWRPVATPEQLAWLQAMRDPEAARQYRIDHGGDGSFPPRQPDPREGRTLGRQYGKASKEYQRQITRGKAHKLR